jgi:hypothetical protein
MKDIPKTLIINQNKDRKEKELKILNYYNRNQINKATNNINTSNNNFKIQKPKKKTKKNLPIINPSITSTTDSLIATKLTKTALLPIPEQPKKIVIMD